MEKNESKNTGKSTDRGNKLGALLLVGVFGLWYLTQCTVRLKIENIHSESIFRFRALKLCNLNMILSLSLYSLILSSCRYSHNTKQVLSSVS